jgi:hypothetical protein
LPTSRRYQAGSCISKNCGCDRIFDHELVAAVQRIAGNGTGDTRWKVPGGLDWSSTDIYNPRVDVTKATTTLYASDRHVFVFLVDDLNPIEAEKLPDGSPDRYFRGFYYWKSAGSLHLLLNVLMRLPRRRQWPSRRRA